LCFRFPIVIVTFPIEIYRSRYPVISNSYSRPAVPVPFPFPLTKYRSRNGYDVFPTVPDRFHPYPYLAIFGRGFMNKFDVVIRQQFLCMKMPAPKGVITVFGNQQEARNIEKGHTPGQTNVYQLKAADERKETCEEPKRDKEKMR
jgi:hypothetical protein